MKKTVLIILIIIVLCSIACVSVIALHDRNVNDTSTVSTITEELTEYATEETDSSQETIETVTLDYDDLDEDAIVGDSIIQNTTELDSTEVSPDATTEFPDCFDLELEIISQFPELPAGCESVSLTMILNYLGYDLDKTDIVDNYLVYSGNFVMGYCGDPYSYDTGGGCYAPGMTITANNFLSENGNKHIAENITGTDFDTLLEYVAQGHPILIWSTINMAYCNKGAYNYDEEGNPYAWDYNEHCVVLTGYDLKANSVTVYDPIDGVLYRKKDEFESIYNDMNQMAIIIREAE